MPFGRICRVECQTRINVALPSSNFNCFSVVFAVSNPHVWPTLYWMTGRRWDCNMRKQCHCDKRRIPFGAIEDGTVYWNLVCFFRGGGGGPAQKFGLFVTAGAGQRQVLRTDCLPILNKPHPYSSKTKEHMSHAINPPSCGKKGGGHKNVCVSKTLRCVSQRKLAHKQNIGISTRKLALWPRKRWVSGGISNSLRPCEMKDLFSTAHIKRCSDLGYNQPHAPS